MSITINGRVLTRRDTVANWAYVNPTPADGEICISTDIRNFKVGNGVTAWSSLVYYLPTSPTPTNIVAGTDATPKVIAYSATSNPGYILRCSTSSKANLIDNATNVTYDGTNFTIYGADNGSGKFVDSFVFAIKP